MKTLLNLIQIIVLVVIVDDAIASGKSKSFQHGIKLPLKDVPYDMMPNKFHESESKEQNYGGSGKCGFVDLTQNDPETTKHQGGASHFQGGGAEISPTIVGAPTTINPNDTEVKATLKYVYDYIVSHDIIYIEGPFETKLNPPINVNGTQQLVNGMLYNLYFDIIAEAHCKICPRTSRWQTSKQFTCTVYVYLDFVANPPTYTIKEGPECREIDV